MAIFTEQARQRLLEIARKRHKDTLELSDQNVKALNHGAMVLRAYTTYAESLDRQNHKATPKDSIYNPKTGIYTIDIIADELSQRTSVHFRPLDLVPAEPASLQWTFEKYDIGDLGYIWMNVRMTMPDGVIHALELKVASRVNKEWRVISRIKSEWTTVEQEMVVDYLATGKKRADCQLAPFEVTVNPDKEVILDLNKGYRMSFFDVPGVSPGEKLVAYPEQYRDGQVVFSLYRSQNNRYRLVVSDIYGNGKRTKFHQLPKDVVNMLNLYMYQLHQARLSLLHEQLFNGAAEKLSEKCDLTERAVDTPLIHPSFMGYVRHVFKQITQTPEIPPHTSLCSYNDDTTGYRWIEASYQDFEKSKRFNFVGFTVREVTGEEAKYTLCPWIGLAYEQLLQWQLGKMVPRTIDPINFIFGDVGDSLPIGFLSPSKNMSIDISEIHFPDIQASDEYILQLMRMEDDTLWFSVEINGIFRAVCELTKPSLKLKLVKTIPPPVPSEEIEAMIQSFEQSLHFETPALLLPLTVGANKHAVRLGTIHGKQVTLPIRPYMNLQPGERLQLIVRDQTAGYLIFDLRRIGQQPFASYNFYPGEKVFKIREDEGGGVLETVTVADLIQVAVTTRRILDFSKPDQKPNE